MKRLLVPIVALLMSSLFVSSPSASALGAGEYEIAYDDGTPGIGSAWQPCNYWAVLFTVPEPPGYPCDLVGSRLYIMGNTVPFEVVVYDSDGVTVLWSQIIQATDESGWSWVDVMIAPPLMVYQDFFIALHYTESGGNFLGCDTDAPAGRSYYGPPMSSDLLGFLGFDGNWMIRAMVAEYERYSYAVRFRGYASGECLVVDAVDTFAGRGRFRVEGFAIAAGATPSTCFVDPINEPGTRVRTYRTSLRVSWDNKRLMIYLWAHSDTALGVFFPGLFRVEPLIYAGYYVGDAGLQYIRGKAEFSFIDSHLSATLYPETGPDLSFEWDYSEARVWHRVAVWSIPR